MTGEHMKTEAPSSEKVVDRGTIYPAGIAAVWIDLAMAVADWERRPSASADEHLVTKWNRFRDALLNFEASPHG
jgi:hypothetical protein